MHVPGQETSQSEPMPPGGEFPIQETRGGKRLTSHTVSHRSSHTVQAIEKLAAVVLDVPEINDCENDENDQKSDKNSHLISPSVPTVLVLNRRLAEQLSAHGFSRSARGRRGVPDPAESGERSLKGASPYLPILAISLPSFSLALSPIDQATECSATEGRWQERTASRNRRP